MTFTDIMAWLLTAFAALSACLLGLNLAFLCRRMNRPTYLAHPGGDLLVALLLGTSVVSFLGAIYNTVLATDWPVHIITLGLIILAAPFLHQALPRTLRDRAGGALLLAMACLLALFLLLTS